MGKKQNKQAFTIVELLVVIVVIGILAAITIVSYSGISNKAIVASLQSDLSSDSKNLKLYYVEYGYYPSLLDSNFCPSNPTPDTRYCIKATSDTTLNYNGGSQTFTLTATKNGITYYINENIAPTLINLPVVENNTVASITSTSATIGATVANDKGSVVTDYGMCWGASLKPTTNCFSNKSILALVGTIGSGTYTNGMAISPDGSYLYVANSLSNNISVFSRNASTSALTLKSTTLAGTFPRAARISPDGKNVYSTNAASKTVSMYSVDSSTGALSALGTPTVPISGEPNSLIFSPDGTSVYVANSTNATLAIFDRNISTGLLTPAITPSIETLVSADNISISPDGLYVYVPVISSNTVLIYGRNPSNGSLSAQGSIPTIASPYSLQIAPDGRYAYVLLSNGSINVYSRDVPSGALTASSPNNVTSGGTVPSNFNISPDGLSIYIADYATNILSVFSRNKDTGQLTYASPYKIATGAAPRSVAISPDGKSVYVPNGDSNNISIFNRNSAAPTNGSAFTQLRSGLTSGSTIHYRGYAVNSNGTSYSSDSTFVTP